MGRRRSRSTAARRAPISRSTTSTFTRCTARSPPSRVSGGLRARVDAAAQAFDGDLADRARGLALNFAARVENRRVSLTRARLVAAAGTLDGKGELALDGARAFTFAGTATRFDPSRLGQFPAASLDGTLQVAGTLAPAWTLVADAKLGGNATIGGLAARGTAHATLAAGSARDVAVDVAVGDARLALHGNAGRSGDALAFTLDVPNVAAVAPLRARRQHPPARRRARRARHARDRARRHRWQRRRQRRASRPGGWRVSRHACARCPRRHTVQRAPGVRRAQPCRRCRRHRRHRAGPHDRARACPRRRHACRAPPDARSGQRRRPRATRSTRRACHRAGGGARMARQHRRLRARGHDPRHARRAGDIGMDARAHPRRCRAHRRRRRQCGAPGPRRRWRPHFDPRHVRRAAAHHARDPRRASAAGGVDAHARRPLERRGVAAARRHARRRAHGWRSLRGRRDGGAIRRLPARRAHAGPRGQRARRRLEAFGDAVVAARGRRATRGHARRGARAGRAIARCGVGGTSRRDARLAGADAAVDRHVRGDRWPRQPPSHGRRHAASATGTRHARRIRSARRRAAMGRGAGGRSRARDAVAGRHRARAIHLQGRRRHARRQGHAGARERGRRRIAHHVARRQVPAAEPP